MFDFHTKKGSTIDR